MSERALATTQKQGAALIASSQGAILQRKCACGNHTMGGGECTECRKAKLGPQRKLIIGASSDPLELEADRVAEAVVSGRFADTKLPKFPPSAVKPLFKPEPGAGASPDPKIIEAGLRSPGQPLDLATRSFMESRFGYDFSQVRIHTDAKAAESARTLNAMAYTFGRDVIFGPGRYSPMTSSGARLLAHELTHTIQQTGENVGTVVGKSRSRRDDGGDFLAHDLARPIKRPGGATSAIQRQEAGQNAAISVKQVFPYPEKSRLLVNRLLPDEILDTFRKYADNPKSALALRVLRASEGQIATVNIATEDVFEATIPSVAVPAEGNSPAQTVNDVALRFVRRLDGKFFKFEMKTGPTTLFDQEGITAQKSGDEITLSPPTGAVSATVRPGSKSGQLEIVGEGPLGGEIPILQLTKLADAPLPDAPAANEEQKKLVQQISQQAAKRRQESRQEIGLGAGVQVGSKLDPVVAASWSISFNPTVRTAGLLQIPLRVDIEYAPNKSLLGGVSSGASLTLPTRFPLNVRVAGGLAAGTIEGTAGGSGKPPLLPAFGPTIGGGIGVGGKTFRVEVDYQHLQNLVRSSPNVDTVLLSGGVKF